MPDIRNFFSSKGGAPPPKPAPKKEEETKKTRASAYSRVLALPLRDLRF
jgi:hypothetical protein